MNKKIVITITTIILLILISTGIVLAENLNELQTQKNELQQQIEKSNEEISKLQIELTENLEQLNKINEKIYQYEDEIKLLDTDIQDIEEQIEIVTQKLGLIEENYKNQREILQNRIVALYESGDIVFLDVLLSSNTLPEFISNYYLIGEIAKYDNDLLESIERQRKRIEEVKTILEKNEQNLGNIKNSKEKTTIALENSKIIQNSYINKLTEKEKETQKIIDDCQEELRKVEAQIVFLTTGDVNSDFIGGEFAWPAPGYKTITSNYGMRFHPILKITKIHTGTDIGMPTGAYVIAANDGVVTTATYSSSYGNMIIVNHGGGISTLYAHGSELLVETGQTVKRGDIIMKAGSTGWSTGPHLHFEVRINGQHTDPMPYITIKSVDSNKSNSENIIDENTINENNTTTDNKNGGEE